MIIEYSTSPNLTMEEKLRSLRDSVQRALNEFDEGLSAEEIEKSFQKKLVSGLNIKTVNNESILGRGNLNITGSGTNDYEALINKPSIEGVTLVGNKTFEDLTLVGLTNIELYNIVNGTDLLGD